MLDKPQRLMVNVFSMKQNITLAARIKKMKKGESFVVNDEKDRKDAPKTAKNLRDAGVIDFQVTTRAVEGTESQFLVIAI